MICPRCGSENVVRNGNNTSGKPKYICKKCRKQITVNPEHRKISEEKKVLIDRLLLERISLAGICRVVGVSKRWLQSYIDEKFRSVEKKVKPIRKKKFV